MKRGFVITDGMLLLEMVSHRSLFVDADMASLLQARDQCRDFFGGRAFSKMSEQMGLQGSVSLRAVLRVSAEMGQGASQGIVRRGGNGRFRRGWR